MLSPSQGFCCCLPVRVGALVVSLLSFLGSGILAGITLISLSTVSAHITSVQTAGFYLTSLSWSALAFFSLLGFISVILQHPLMLTVFVRFILYHIPASLLCNLFFTIVFFHSYRSINAVLGSPLCSQASRTTPICNAFTLLEILTWVYLFLLLPACIFQSYVYVIIKRFIFVVSGEWAHQQEESVERKRRSMGMAGLRRRSTITQEIGRGGRRRAKALWFTMETSTSPVAGDSFLPSMILSPIDFTSPPRTSLSMPSSAGILSPFRSPKPGKQGPKSSLPPLPDSSLESKKPSESSNRSTNMDMDFSDPVPVTATTLWQDPGEETESQCIRGVRSEQASSSTSRIEGQNIMKL